MKPEPMPGARADPCRAGRGSPAWARRSGAGSRRRGRWRADSRPPCLGRALHHADIDHRRAHLLDQVAEVGQAEAVGRDHRRGGRLGVRGAQRRGLGKEGAERERDGGDGQEFAHVVGHPCSATERFGAGVPAATCRGRGLACAVPDETCVFKSGRARALQEAAFRKWFRARARPGGSPRWRVGRRTRAGPAGGDWRVPGGGRAG